MTSGQRNNEAFLRISTINGVCNQHNVSDGGNVVHANSFCAAGHACRDCGCGRPVALCSCFTCGRKRGVRPPTVVQPITSTAQGAPVMRPKKPFRLGPISNGARQSAPGASNARRTSGNRRSSSTLLACVLAKPRPGSSSMRQGSMPACCARAPLASSSAPTSAHTSAASGGAKSAGAVQRTGVRRTVCCETRLLHRGGVASAVHEHIKRGRFSHGCEEPRVEPTTGHVVHDVRAFSRRSARHGRVECIYAQQRAAHAASQRGDDRDDALRFLLLRYPLRARARRLPADVHDVCTRCHHVQRGIGCPRGAAVVASTVAGSATIVRQRDEAFAGSDALMRFAHLKLSGVTFSTPMMRVRWPRRHM